MPTVQGLPAPRGEGAGTPQAGPDPGAERTVPVQDAEAAVDRAFEQRLGDLGDALAKQAQQATRDRVIPALVVVVGATLVVFWCVAGLLPDGRAWPRPQETATGLVVGGLVLLGGAALSLLADYWPARVIADATKTLSETDRKHVESRDRRSEEK